MSDVKVILAPEKTLRGSLAGGNTLKGGMSMGVISNGGSADLTGYATEEWVREGYQPKGNYATKSEIPTVPTKLSAFTNDAGFVTEDALEDLGGKAYVQNTQPANMEEGEFWYNPDEEPDAPGGAFDTYTKAEIDAIMGNYITDINNLVGGGA